jgi:hypothetical protein
MAALVSEPDCITHHKSGTNAGTGLATGLADKSICPQRQYAAVAALCAAGSHVVWKACAGVSHNGTVHAAYPDEYSTKKDFRRTDLEQVRLFLHFFLVGGGANAEVSLRSH